MKTRNRTGNFFEVKVSFITLTDDGCRKRVKEQVASEAISFAEAEHIVHIQYYARVEDLIIADISRAKYSEIFFTDEPSHDKFFEVRIEFITLDEKTSKEKKSITTYLTQADSFDTARKNVTDIFNQSMLDYVIKSIKETKIIDVFELNI